MEIRAEARRGRGAVTNPTGRYEASRTLPFDDGWGTVEDELPALPTIVTAEQTRRAITTNTSPDIPFDRSLNPYKGCEHGCVYCYARPTHAWLGLSPGLDFETRIISKPDAPMRLRDELRRASYRPETVVIGANTDPYQPVERRLRITRALLEVLLEFRHPVGIITKSAGVLRDVDLLAELAERDLVRVMVSITTLDPELSRRMEPRAASPLQRLRAVRELAAAKVPVGVLAAPMIPALNDVELEAILEASASAGAQSAGYILIRLPLEVRELFENWLRQHYPMRAAHVLTLLEEMREGALNQSRFFERMRGTGVFAELLARRFELARRRLGLDGERAALDTTQFRIPPGDGRQLGLFG
jgi:DNA repair photolyase